MDLPGTPESVSKKIGILPGKANHYKSSTMEEEGGAGNFTLDACQVALASAARGFPGQSGFAA